MFNREKFKALVHYICWRVEPSELGSVKLNKVLWYSDTNRYLIAGDSITGAKYVKQQFGPVPSAILPVLDELKAEGLLAIREASYYGYPKREFFALSPANLDLFTAAEMSLIDSEIDRICYGHTATSISEESHDDVWKLAAIGEELPYHTVFASRRAEITGEDIAWARQQLASPVHAE